MLSLRSLLGAVLGNNAASQKLRSLRYAIRQQQHRGMDPVLRALNSGNRVAKAAAVRWIMENLDDSVDGLISKYRLDEDTLMHASFEPASEGVGGIIVLDPKHLPEGFMIRDGETGASEPFGRPQQYLRYTFMLKGYEKHTAVHEEGHDIDNLFASDYDGRIYGFSDQADFIVKKEALLGAELHSFLREVYASPEWKAASRVADPKLRDAQRTQLIRRHIVKVQKEYLPGYINKILRNLQNSHYSELNLSALEVLGRKDQLNATMDAMLQAVEPIMIAATDAQSFSAQFLAQFREDRIPNVTQATILQEANLRGVFRVFNQETDPTSLDQAVAISDATGQQNGLTDFSKKSFERILEQDQASGFSRLYERDGKILGYLLAAPTSFGGAYIYNIGVDTASQQGGIGTVLLYDLAKRLGTKMGPDAAVMLSVETRNVRAIRLYEALGFSRVGSARTAADGRVYYDYSGSAAVVMEKARIRLTRPRAELREDVEPVRAENQTSFAEQLGGSDWAVVVSVLRTILSSGGSLSDREVAERFWSDPAILGLLNRNGIRPMSIEGEVAFINQVFESMAPDAKTATAADVQTFARSVIVRAPSGLQAEEAARVSKPARDLRQLFEKIILNRTDVERFGLVGQFITGDNPSQWGVVSAVASSVLLVNADLVPGLRNYLESVGVDLPRAELRTAGDVTAQDWQKAIVEELLASGKDKDFVESLKLTLLKIDMLNISRAEQRELANVFAKFLIMMPNIDVATAFLGQNNIVLKLHAGDQQFQRAEGRADRLAYVSYDSRGARAPIIGLNVAKLLDTSIRAEVRAVKYLGIPLCQEEAHYELTKVLRMVPELVKPGNEAMYDAMQEVLAYVITLNDMKQASEDYSAKIPELDFTQNIVTITRLWEKATGLSLTSELNDQILALPKTSDAATVQKLLRQLMVSIAERQTTLDGAAAQAALVGKPVDQVMKYDDKFMVAVQIADAGLAELCQPVMREMNNLATMDVKGNVVDGMGNELTIEKLAQRYPGRTVVAMSNMVAPVTELVNAQKAFALLFDDAMIRELKQTRNVKKIRELLEALRILAMSLDAKTWTSLLQAGAGMGGPGSAAGIPTISAYFDSIRQSVFAEILTARAA
jgi:ribosomal protein S18 acetylase RimI-like enzyme/predicted nuclease of predicted toxin-antitoxin system